MISILVGAALGFLSGLGIGGGSLLMLWLTVVLGQDHAMARSINLLFFLPTAASALVCHWKSGCLDRPTVRAALPFALGAALVGAWIASAVDTGLLRKPFGIYLLLSGAGLLLPRKKA